MLFGALAASGRARSVNTITFTKVPISMDSPRSLRERVPTAGHGVEQGAPGCIGILAACRRA